MNVRNGFLQDSGFALEEEDQSMQMDEEGIGFSLDSSRNCYNQELVLLVVEYVD